jgi:hypothetical protein
MRPQRSYITDAGVRRREDAQPVLSDKRGMGRASEQGE